MRALQLSAYGDPVANIELVELPEPPPPRAGEVLLDLEYSPINPADILLAMGYYAIKPPLPSVIGNEGVGRVAAIGSGVIHLKVGDRVVPPLSSFTWRERMVIPAAHLVPLPAEADPKQLSMLRVNPVTAALLLSEFRDLKAADWIVQNAANSGVGRSVIAMAKGRGIKTVNIVRRKELVAELLAAGADAVAVDGPQVAEQIREMTAGAEIGLGFDCLSGPASGVLASVLAPRATLVTYGAMTLSPISISPGDIIYKSLSLTGFFLGHAEHDSKVPQLLRQGARMMADGSLKLPVAEVYPLARFKEALEHAIQGGKVLLALAK